MLYIIMDERTLWIYGDSFSLDYKEIEWQWFKNLANYWGIKKIKNFSAAGASQHHTLYHISQSELEWRENDKIIILLSEMSRSWFVPNQPHINGILLYDLKELCNKIDSSGKLHKAIESYHVYLQHAALVQTQLYSTLGYLSYLSQNKSIDMLVLNCVFDAQFTHVYERFSNHLNLAKGDLLDISLSELEQNQDLRNYIWGCDPRANHLCKHTHQLLSDLIIEQLKDQTSIDLTSLILNNPLITKKNVDDINLHESEFIPGIYNITKKLCERLF